jgi:putative hydrolase of the HAD superfamily
VSEAQWWDVVGARLDIPAATLAELRRDLAVAGKWSDALVTCLRSCRRATKIAAVANAWPYLRARLRGDGLAELFDEVVLSCEVGCAKPDPRIYRLTLERLGVAPGDALFVDDMADNVEAAESIGMQGHLHRTAADTAESIGRFAGVRPA